MSSKRCNNVLSKNNDNIFDHSNYLHVNCQNKAILESCVSPVPICTNVNNDEVFLIKGERGKRGRPGANSILGYISASTNLVATIANGGLVSFNINGPAGGDIPAFIPTSNNISLPEAGVYEINYYVRGIPNSFGTASPLIFQLLNGTTSIPYSKFASDVQATITSTSQSLIVNGFVTVSLPPDSTIQLQNVTGTQVQLNGNLLVTDIILAYISIYKIG